MRLLLPALLLVVAMPAFAQSSGDWIHGRWFGSGQPNDRSQMWLDITAPDGSFHVLHRACRQGKAFDTVEEGRWSLQGDVLTVTIEKVNGQAVPRDVDVNRILKQDRATQTYRYEETGFVYNSRKVDAKFQMPPCDLVS